MKGKSFLYIHSKLLLEPVFRYKLNIKTRIRLIFEKLFIFLFYKNVDLIVVQTPSMMQLSRDIFKKGRPFVFLFSIMIRVSITIMGLNSLIFFIPPTDILIKIIRIYFRLLLFFLREIFSQA